MVVSCPFEYSPGGKRGVSRGGDFAAIWIGYGIMQTILEHLHAALALLDAESKHAAAAKIDHLIQELQGSMDAASGTS
jgi:hypothetical protein